MKLSDLKLNPDNPRTISEEEFERLKRKIKKNPDGLTAQKITHKDGVIIAGNQRWRAINELGLELKEEWFKDATGWTDEQIRDWLIDTNVSDGKWDWDVLPNQYESEYLAEHGVELPYDLKDEAEVEEDEAPEVSSEPPKSKLGEIYQLGRHKVMCGDSTDNANVELLMAGVKADIGFTSPPYNAGDNVRGKFYANDDDNKTNDEYTNFLTDTATITLDYCDYSFINLQLLEANKLSLIDFQTNMRDYVKDILVWNKSIAPPHINKGTFATKWEYIFALSKQSKSRSFPTKWQGKYHNVIETENNSGNEFAKEHKAGFPVALPLWIINKMDFAKTVLDIFIGTGTTLIACEQTDRICYGMELDPKYVDVIRKRYAKFTNNNELPEDWEARTPAI